MVRREVLARKRGPPKRGPPVRGPPMGEAPELGQAKGLRLPTLVAGVREPGQVLKELRGHPGGKPSPAPRLRRAHGREMASPQAVAPRGRLVHAATIGNRVAHPLMSPIWASLAAVAAIADRHIHWGWPRIDL